MRIEMESGAIQQDISAVIARVEALGLPVHLSRQNGNTTIAAVFNGHPEIVTEFERMAGVAQVIRISPQYKLASRVLSPLDTQVTTGSLRVGGGAIGIIAGPCAVEGRNQLLELAQAVKEAGAHALRGGAYKPRTSPYSFQGLGEEGLEYLAEARERYGLPVVTEVMAPEKVALVASYADVLQVGARNMQNYSLLHAVGESQKPVLLKRGMMSTVDELLMSAEYILSHGNDRVILCERGIRTFETSTRNTTDINALPVLKAATHLPVLLDPSHSTGKRELVAAVARAGIAAGADGLIVEVHQSPDEALSDGAQSLEPEAFARLVGEVNRIAVLLNELRDDANQERRLMPSNAAVL